MWTCSINCLDSEYHYSLLNNECASNLLQCSNWVRVQYPWRYPCCVIQEKRGNTKRRIEVEQVFLMLFKKKERKRRKRRVRVLILWRFPCWVMRERRGNTKRGPHEKLLYLLQCSEKSMSIQKTFSMISTLSNTEKAREY